MAGVLAARAVTTIRSTSEPEASATGFINARLTDRAGSVSDGFCEYPSLTLPARIVYDRMAASGICDSLTARGQTIFRGRRPAAATAPTTSATTPATPHTIASNHRGAP